MRVSVRRAFLFTFLLFLLSPAGDRRLDAQLRVHTVAELPGEAALKLQLRKLASSGTFMQTTAHPDDEDNGLLAKLGLGDGMRAVLVSATRGDGGQNEIGPELFQALGVLRTEELLAAHRIDGAEQFFTRAVDFGFSFSAEESLEKWGHQEILGDLVRLVRTVRPDVIAGFLCGGGGGGQHHQASTRLTNEAFRAAADPARFPEQIRQGLRPWQASRVFCTDVSSFAPGARPDAATLRVSPASFDPVLGRTYAELGLEARSMHKCQGTSQLLLLPGGQQARHYRLTDTVLGAPGVAPKDLFDGIDTSLAGLARFAGVHPPGGLTAGLAAIATSVSTATGAANARGPAAAAEPLATGLAALRDLRARLATLGLDDTARYEVDFRLAQKESQFQQALLLTHGIRLEALADDGVVTVGQPIKVSLVAGNNGAPDVTLRSVTLHGVEAQATCGGPVPPGGATSCTAAGRVGQAPVSTPYWAPRKDSARYDFDPDVPFGVSFTPTPFRAAFALTIAGIDVTVERPIEFRYSDLFAGEKRSELQVVPFFAVRTSPDIAVIPSAVGTGAAAMARAIEVTVTNQQKGTATGTVALAPPEGWRVSPASYPLSFSREDEQDTVKFTLTPPPGVRPGEFSVKATATTNGISSSTGYHVVEYPHIQRRHVAEPAATRVKVIDVAIAPGLKVGYVMGVGDRVPEAIAQLGAEVHLIDAEELASGDLSRYDVIMTGVRAYERRPDLRAHNHHLIEYVEQGGTLLVNYNKAEFNQAQYAPFPAKTGMDRVTDEGAPVEVLAPSHPVFNVPNKIGPDAWANWVQERGTYFLAERDSRYVDLVRMSDPFPYNAGARTGALVEAAHGKGRWIYIGLGLWRQLPAGTDGAYELLANLLSLGHERR